MGDGEMKVEAVGRTSHGPDGIKPAEVDPVEIRQRTSVPNKERRQRNVESIMLRIERQSDFNFIMDWPNWKPVFLAMYFNDVEKLSSLLRDAKTNVDLTDEKGNTVLHCAVLLACLFGDTDGDLYNCIDLLMTQKIKVNMPNKKGYTPIGLAVHHLHKTCVERMLKHPSAHRLYLDYYPGNREFTVRELIMEAYPDLQPFLPAPLMERLKSRNYDKKLLAALQRDKYEVFRQNLDSTNPNPWYYEPYHSSLLEIACQMKDRRQFVELLLHSGANPNITNRVTGMPLLHATARSGNFELLEIFLDVKITDTSVKDNEDRTILHWLAGVSERKPGDKQRVENCIELLLNQITGRKLLLDQDRSGNTALSIAVEHEFEDRIILLLDVDPEYIDPDHIIPILKSASRSMLEAILDGCFDSTIEPVTSEVLKVTFKSMALAQMVALVETSQHKDLLRHPVIPVFLNLLWKKVKGIFFANVILYVAFLLSLTAYILVSEYFNIQNNVGAANNTNRSLNLNDIHLTSGMKDESLYNISNGLWYTLMILLGLLLMREVCQLLLYRKGYIKSCENWIELLLIAATFASCSGVMDSVQIKRHFFAIAILLGWFELVLLLGRLPLLSVQTEMLKRVSSTFLKFMAGYMVLILAFGFSFYILFKENSEGGDVVLFGNPFISLLKTIVMFAGEFEASNLPFNTLPGTSHVVFLLFIFLVTIVLLNLLNGLAVGDTRKITKDAETLSLSARVKLITDLYDVYKALPDFMCPRKGASEVFELCPNKPNEMESTDVQSLLRIITEKREGSKKEKSLEHVENWKFFADKLSELQLQSKEIRQILMKIQTHLNIGET